MFLKKNIAKIILYKIRGVLIEEYIKKSSQIIMFNINFNFVYCTYFNFDKSAFR